MFESIKRKLNSHNEGNTLNTISLDFKLFFVYHIVMMILFGFRPIQSPIHQVYLAVVLLTVIIFISILHKIKSNWSWPGLTFRSVPSIAMHLILTYLFFAFSAYIIVDGVFPDLSSSNIEGLITNSWAVILQAASYPVLTPWFLAGAGIVFMNSMVIFRFSAHKKSEFEAQCGNS